MLNPHGSALFQRIAEMGITVRQIQTQRLANTGGHCSDICSSQQLQTAKLWNNTP